MILHCTCSYGNSSNTFFNMILEILMMFEDDFTALALILQVEMSFPMNLHVRLVDEASTAHVANMRLKI